MRGVLSRPGSVFPPGAGAGKDGEREGGAAGSLPGKEGRGPAGEAAGGQGCRVQRRRVMAGRPVSR